MNSTSTRCPQSNDPEPGTISGPVGLGKQESAPSILIEANEEGVPGGSAISESENVTEAFRLLVGLESNRMGSFFLQMALGFAVPMRIFGILDRGGVTECDLARIKSYASDLCEHGSDLFIQSSSPGGTGERFNQVADLIAVLSFLRRGGVPAFGSQWDPDVYRSLWERKGESVPDRADSIV